MTETNKKKETRSRSIRLLCVCGQEFGFYPDPFQEEVSKDFELMDDVLHSTD